MTVISIVLDIVEMDTQAVALSILAMVLGVLLVALPKKLVRFATSCQNSPQLEQIFM